MKKFKKFIWYFARSPLYAILYVIVYKLPGYICKIHQVKDVDLVEKVRKGVSLVRFGDGDIYIAHGGDQSYQKSSKRLREKLFDIFRLTHTKEYVKDDALILIGVPTRYLQLSNNDLKKTEYYNAGYHLK